MNMKKTIAAISAATVAVSAMAATVSAEETTKTFTYKLTNNVVSDTNGDATFQATIQNAVLPDVPAAAAVDATATASNAGTTLTFTATDTKIPDATFTCTEVTAAAKGPGFFNDAAGTTANTTYDADLTGTYADGDTILIKATSGEIWKNGTNTGATVTTAPGADVTLYYVSKAATTETWTATIGGTAVTKTNAQMGTDYGIAISGTVAKNDTITTTAYKAATNAQTGAKAEEVTFNVDPLGANGVGYGDVKELTLKVNYKGAGDQSKTYVYSKDQGAANYNPRLTNTGFTFKDELTGFPSDGKIDVQLTLKIATKADENGVQGTNSYKKINGGYDEKTRTTYNPQILGITSDEGVMTPVVCINLDGNGTSKYVMPFETDNSYNTDIIGYLEGRTTNQGEALDRDETTAKKEHYDNVMALINDAIANSTNVTFKFNTAASPICFVPQGQWGLANWIRFDNYQDAYKWSVAEHEAKGLPIANAKALAIYADYGDSTDQYTKFGQHLYDWYYIPDGTGNTGYNWTGTNLFAGALVINQGYAMSLSETDVFDWTETSLSFDWDAIQQNAMTDNDYANYVQTMNLATSTKWYWDSMDVIITQGEGEDAGADAGADGDGAEIEEDETGDEEVDLGDEEEETEPEETEPEETETEPVVDEPASNPVTGNASVALAVIPVALAAAAIVAKKRG